MKSFSYATILITLWVLFVGCSQDHGKNHLPDDSAKNNSSMEVSIEGMSCMACVAKVKKTLSDLDGVDEVAVSLENKNATFHYNPQKISPSEIEQTIHDIGYTAGTLKELTE